MDGAILFFILPVSQLLRYLLPGDSPVSHKHHHMVEKIRYLILDLLRVGILGRYDDLSGLLPQFFEDLVNTFVKEIIGDVYKRQLSI